MDAILKTVKAEELNLIRHLLTGVISAEEMSDIADIVTAADFADKRNAEVWRLLTDLAGDGVPPSLSVLHTRAVKCGITIDLGRLVSVKAGACNPYESAAVIHEVASRRMMYDRLTEIMLNFEDIDYTAAKALDDIEAIGADIDNGNELSVVWQRLHRDLMDIIHRKRRGEIPLGIMTGYTLMDREGGFGEGDLVVVAGRTSNGKTAFALNLAINIASRNVPTAVYSLEMTNMQIGNRVLANIAAVDATRIKLATELTDAELQVLESCGYDMPLYFNETVTNTKADIFRSIRREVAKRGIKVVFVDYLQLLNDKGKDKRIDIGNIANELKALAKRLKITVVMLSQLAREVKGTNPVPKISELKESGDIENAADAIYLVYRPEQHSPELRYPNMTEQWSHYSTHRTALIICPKNRNGQCGEQILAYSPETMRFWQKHSDAYEMLTPEQDTSTYNTAFTPYG